MESSFNEHIMCPNCKHKMLMVELSDDTPIFCPICKHSYNFEKWKYEYRINNMIVVDLDGMTKDNALDLAYNLKYYIWGVKLNDLLDAEGAKIITEFKNIGINVCADPKIKDIPNTVVNRVSRYVDVGADFITIFVDNGVKSLEAAVQSSGDSKIIGVTVLTSISEVECQILYHDCIYGVVTRFIHDIYKFGIDGIVCSPKELSTINAVEKIRNKKIIKITPGIRPIWCYPDDQERTSTPKTASRLSDFLVIGGPITQALDPISATKQILKEIKE